MGRETRSPGDHRRPMDVVCLGILVADVVARPVGELPRAALALLDEVSLHGGGCALNTATGLKRLGLEAAVAGMVGDDAFGDFLLQLLDERRIERAAVVRSRVPTSATVVLVDGDGEQVFLHTLGASAALLFKARATYPIDVASAAATTREARSRRSPTGRPYRV